MNWLEGEITTHRAIILGGGGAAIGGFLAWEWWQRRQATSTANAIANAAAQASADALLGQNVEDTSIPAGGELATQPPGAAILAALPPSASEPTITPMTIPAPPFLTASPDPGNGVNTSNAIPNNIAGGNTTNPNVPYGAIGNTLPDGTQIYAVPNNGGFVNGQGQVVEANGRLINGGLG